MERMLEVLLRRRDRGDSSSDEEEEVPLMESDELETEEDQESRCGLSYSKLMKGYGRILVLLDHLEHSTTSERVLASSM